MDSNDKIKAVGINIQEKANLIWNVANSLFGAYKPHAVFTQKTVLIKLHGYCKPGLTAKAGKQTIRLFL